MDRNFLKDEDEFEFIADLKTGTVTMKAKGKVAWGLLLVVAGLGTIIISRNPEVLKIASEKLFSNLNRIA